MRVTFRPSVMGAAALWSAFFMCVASVGGLSQPASAQGSIVCDYGSAKYKRCCDESYRRRANMGARARADDIDACMKDRDGPARDQPSSRRDSPAERRTGGSDAVTSLRRLDCATANCPEGCAADEIAISGFCGLGSSATLDGDRKIYCATSTGSEWPKVMICAKR
jgi:hypothetical protein